MIESEIIVIPPLAVYIAYRLIEAAGIILHIYDLDQSTAPSPAYRRLRDFSSVSIRLLRPGLPVSP